MYPAEDPKRYFNNQLISASVGGGGHDTMAFFPKKSTLICTGFQRKNVKYGGKSVNPDRCSISFTTKLKEKHNSMMTKYLSK